MGRWRWYLVAVTVLVLGVAAAWGIRHEGRAATVPGSDPATAGTGASEYRELGDRDPMVGRMRPDPNRPVLVTYHGPVEHIFFHPLIAYPDLAFKGPQAMGYDDWFVTIPEFTKIIDQLYRNGYVLVDIHSLYTEKTENGKTTLAPAELQLPAGKKPLVLSIDDLNYYDYMREQGNVYKLIIDSDGRVATWGLDPAGKPVTSRTNEIIPILDDFVAAHPDFSVNGAKGLIALTGYQGILGYRTNDPSQPDYEEQKAQALAVVERLKATGWTFASHGWGHLDAAKISYATFKSDTERWKREVEPLVGPTSVYVYPFGSAVKPGDPKFQLLLDSGFRMICAIGPDPFLQVTPAYARMDRRHIDGIALRQQRKLLLPLFDADQVIDLAERPKR